jgi:enoyl-[acyl-carrier protein] reductase II
MVNDNPVCRLLKTAYPIIQGPMRLITLGQMAADVSNSGGFGQIAASGLSIERLRAEIRIARERTDRPFGVNIPLYRSNALAAVEVAIEEGLSVISTSAGNPETVMPSLKKAGIKVLHKISTVKMALKAQAAGVDAIIATGYEAGGHVGRDGIANFCLIPQLADSLTIPIICAGGIADSRGLVAAFALGAQGIEMGTALLATRQCPVPEFFKEMILKADSTSTILLGRGTMPMRVLKNEASSHIEDNSSVNRDSGIQQKIDRVYISSGGRPETSIMPCGQISGLIKEINEIDQLFDRIMQGTRGIVEGLDYAFSRPVSSVKIRGDIEIKE